MKKIYIFFIALFLLGFSGYARAAEEAFVIDEELYAKHQAQEQQNQQKTQNKMRARAKGTFNGSSAYRGGLTGQVATLNKNKKKNGKMFEVRPVRGKDSAFGNSFRYGDMSQSPEARLSHSYNN